MEINYKLAYIDKNKNIDVANSKFLLATNVSCKGNSIIKSLSSASVDKIYIIQHIKN